MADKALVTGANGFLGRYIAEHLLARADLVTALCRRPDEALTAAGAKVIQGDIRDKEAVARACRDQDVVYHVAAVAGIWGSWKYFHSTNTEGTQNVIDACQKHNVRKLVYTSSPSVTFDGTAQEGIDETAPYPDRWLCHYPHTKALAEQQVLQASGKNGLLACSLRPHLIWGPRDRHLIPRVVARARAGQLRRVGDGSNRIDMIYVDNAAAAHLRAADALQPNSPVAGGAYFLSQGEPVNCWEWINEILGLAKLPPINKSISVQAAWRVGSVLEAVHRLLRIQAEPRMTRFLAAQLGTSHYFDIRAARRDFGYDVEVSTEDGMRRLAAEMAQDG